MEETGFRDTTTERDREETEEVKEQQTGRERERREKREGERQRESDRERDRERKRRCFETSDRELQCSARECCCWRHGTDLFVASRCQTNSTRVQVQSSFAKTH